MYVNNRKVAILFNDNSTLKYFEVPLFIQEEIIRTDSYENKEGKRNNNSSGSER